MRHYATMIYLVSSFVSSYYAHSSGQDRFLSSDSLTSTPRTTATPRFIETPREFASSGDIPAHSRSTSPRQNGYHTLDRENSPREAEGDSGSEASHYQCSNTSSEEDEEVTEYSTDSCQQTPRSDSEDSDDEPSYTERTGPVTGIIEVVMMNCTDGRKVLIETRREFSQTLRQIPQLDLRPAQAIQSVIVASSIPRSHTFHVENGVMIINEDNLEVQLSQFLLSEEHKNIIRQAVSPKKSISLNSSPKKLASEIASHKRSTSLSALPKRKTSQTGLPQAITPKTPRSGRMTLEIATLKRSTSQSTLPNRTTSQSELPIKKTPRSKHLNKTTSQSALPNIRTSQSGFPNRTNSRSALPKRATAQPETPRETTEIPNEQKVDTKAE